MRRTWIRSGDRSLAAQVYEPPGKSTVGAVVVVSSFGFEAEAFHRSAVAFAHRAAAAGFLAIVLDPTGHGDSASARGVEQLVNAWRHDVRAGVALAGRLASDVPTILVGYRLGGSVVASVSDPGITARLAWEPVSGRAFVRRQQLVLAISQPWADDSVRGSELFALDLSPDQIRDLRSLRPPADTTPLVRVWKQEDRDAAQLGLDVPPFYAEVPLSVIDELLASLPRGEAKPLAHWTEAEVSPASLDPRVEGVMESFVHVGPHQLSGVLTRSADASGRTWVLFTAQGAERASGPSGLWTDLARALAARGLVCLRTDRRRIGWHSDPEAAREPNTYTPEGIQDVVEAVHHARASGADRVVIVGSCAGAWLALSAAAQVEVDDVVALNMPAWSDREADFDDSFLAHWNGPSPLEPTSPGRPVQVRAKVVASLRRWPRVHSRAMRAREVVRAIARRSAGLPVLWKVRRATAVHVLLSGRDLDFFEASAGRVAIRALKAAGRKVEVTEVDAIDHGLRTELSRAVVRDLLFRLVQPH